MRVQADELPRRGGRGDGRENITFITWLKSSRRNTATVRFAENAITRYTIEDELPERGPPGHQEEPDGRENQPGEIEEHC